MAAFTYTAPTVGGSADTWGATLNTNWSNLSTFLGSLDSAELAVLDGITVTTAELNILDGVTATAAELNFTDGVTSAIQTQLDAKAAAARTITAGVGLTGGGDLSADLTIDGVTQDTATWEAGTGTTESLVSPAKVKAAVEALAPDQSIGVGQTWQNLIGSRLANTTYQNTTGKPIMVSCSTSALTSALRVSSDNVTFIDVVTGGNLSKETIVPSGHYYRLYNNNNTVLHWAELR